MDNKAFENFMNQDFKSLSDWFSTLNPYEFTFVATIIGGVIAPILNTSQQNSLGNFFEQIGQTLETISSQAQTNNQYRQNTQNNSNFNDQDNDIGDLRMELERLRRKIDGN